MALDPVHPRRDINTAVIFSIQPAQPPYWVYLLALIPLFALLGTGLYLFVLPYLRRGSGAG